MGHLPIILYYIFRYYFLPVKVAIPYGGFQSIIANKNHLESKVNIVQSQKLDIIVPIPLSSTSRGLSPKFTFVEKVT